MALGDCLKWRYEKLDAWALDSKNCWTGSPPIHRWNMWCLRKENDLQMQTALAELDQEGLELLTAGKVWPEFVVSTGSVVAHFRGSNWEFKLLQVKELSHQIFLKAVVSLVLAKSMAFICWQVLHMCVYLNITQQQLQQQYNNWQHFCWLHSDDVFFWQKKCCNLS